MVGRKGCKTCKSEDCKFCLTQILDVNQDHTMVGKQKLETERRPPNGQKQENIII
jgi:hypothetical protein